MSLYVRNSALAWKNVPGQDGKLYLRVWTGSMVWRKVKTLYVRRVHPDTLALEWKKVGDFAAPDPPTGYEIHQDGAGPSGFPERWRCYVHLHSGLPADATAFHAQFEIQYGGAGAWQDIGSGVSSGMGGPLYSDYHYDASSSDKARARVWLTNGAGSTNEYQTNEITTTEFSPYP